jgi:dihydrofolate synthase/folylpolyglutamate synthase
VNRSQIGLQYLNQLTPWNGRGGFALESITKTLHRLDNPQDKLPVIHIAGTNGKGSVSSAVASILGHAGYRVGLNSSPHLQTLNERVVIDGLPIDMEAIGEFAYDIRTAAAKDLQELSFHEAITALSFLAFREMGTEWMVIEVGLGGRLDASNVISRPAATAIVTIDFDHQQILGDTLGQIAAEKAGIIKAGSPLITGDLPLEAEKVITKMAAGVRHYRFRTDYGIALKEGGAGSEFVYWGKDFPISPISRFDFTSPLPGIHQGHNLSVAATIGLAVGMQESDVIGGLQGVYWPARLERFTVDRTNLLMDCAHNPAGIRAFVHYLKRAGEQGIDLTFGVLDTKNWQEMIQILKPHVGHWRLVLPESERALDLDTVRREIGLSGTDVRVSMYGSNYEGLIKDLLDGSSDGVRYVTGSMYMIGKLRNMFSLPHKPIWERKAK